MLIEHRQTRLGQAELRGIVHGIAARPERWLARVRFGERERWYQLLEGQDGYEVWLLSWLPGQHTGFHDHGGSAGALAVAHGTLDERAAPDGRPAATQALPAGTVRSFGPRYIHDVANNTGLPAVSVHAYSPALASMRRYAVTAAGLVTEAQCTAGEW